MNPDPRFRLAVTQPCGDAPDPAFGNDGDVAISTTNGKIFRKYNNLGWVEFAEGGGGGGGASYLIYRALLSQSGTDAPVATVLENTLGGVPIYSRDETGNYRATLAGAFPIGKTFVLTECDQYNADATTLRFGQSDPDSIWLFSRNGSGVAIDLGAGTSSFQILVYP